MIYGNCAASHTTTAIYDPYLKITEAEVTFEVVADEFTVQNVVSTTAANKSLHIYGMARFAWMWAADGIFGRGRAIVSADPSTTPNTASVAEFKSADPVSRVKVLAALDARWALMVARIMGRRNITSAEQFNQPREVPAILTDCQRRCPPTPTDHCRGLDSASKKPKKNNTENDNNNREDKKMKRKNETTKSKQTKENRMRYKNLASRCSVKKPTIIVAMH
ncbi:hypothetical protein B0H63DRAFT_447616 [Podospora didyma]|uniref:Uncharacterized protein n=1 Tax=Podospora didyma TaxID=330526 RepID=A0AAE0NS67_9PEZI|nr:hypothetical protein B0H63DRAFT_447616 [Podospora didyma]